MEPKTVYVNNENIATIVCDSCGKYKTANLSRYLHLPQPIRIKCSCGQQILVRLETRQFYRKKVRLHGTCFPRGMKKEHMYIKDISFQGLGFEISGKDIRKGGTLSIKFVLDDSAGSERSRKDIRKGDTLKITFVLDDSAKSEISEDVVVSHADDGHIGAKFVTASEHTRKVLGFYLF